MKNISVIVVVYNEENRIASFIRSFLWSNDLIIVDKNSIDKTVQIAEEYHCRIINTKYSDTGDEAKYGIEIAQNDWVLMVTASDIIDPGLVYELLELINRPQFSYDVIAIPFSIYVFGICNSRRSPWCSTTKEILFKRDSVSTSNIVHHEIYSKSKKIYHMDSNNKYRFYHLTHEKMGTFLERHTRYSKLETNRYDNEKNGLKKSFRDLLYSIYYVVVKKKSYLYGWDGIALGVAFISYYIMTYLFVWEKFRGKGTEIYKMKREEIELKWEERKNQ